VGHYRVFWDGVFLVAIFDHVQDRILTILPQATYFAVALRDQFLVFRAPHPAAAKYIGECQWCRARIADDLLRTVGYWCTLHRCDKRPPYPPSRPPLSLQGRTRREGGSV